MAQMKKGGTVCNVDKDQISAMEAAGWKRVDGAVPTTPEPEVETDEVEETEEEETEEEETEEEQKPKSRRGRRG